ncbi:FemAB family XrtA/PEP-CTERM system-associated protein [Nitrospira calida]|jgi:FemAB-related protein (PEP-CTERM system-associated)
MEIVCCGQSHQPLWDGYVQQSAAATIGHVFAWQSVIRQTYGHEAFYLLATDGSTAKGIFPLVLVKSFLGTSLTSMPFMDYGGICADNQETAQALLDHAMRLMREQQCQVLEIRQALPVIRIGISCADKVSMLLDLSSGIDRLWRSLPAKVRNQVRKAEKSGLTTTTGGLELLDEFYNVFAVNMRDLGSPVHSRTFFRRIGTAFGSRMRVILVRHGQSTVGSAVCLFFKDTMLVPWASSLREHFAKCPNNLLYWEAIQHGCKHGYRTFDFGRSSVGSGTFEFKKQWGAQPLALPWQLLRQNGGSGSTLSVSDGKYRLFAAIWRRLPVSVSRILGPRIRKHLTN